MEMSCLMLSLSDTSFSKFSTRLSCSEKFQSLRTAPNGRMPLLRSRAVARARVRAASCGPGCGTGQNGPAAVARARCGGRRSALQGVTLSGARGVGRAHERLLRVRPVPGARRALQPELPVFAEGGVRKLFLRGWWCQKARPQTNYIAPRRFSAPPRRAPAAWTRRRPARRPPSRPW